MNELEPASNPQLPDISRLTSWKRSFDETSENGATQKFVRELAQIGLKLKLPLINAAIYKADATSFDLRKLSGYGCYGTPLDRESDWSPKEKFSYF